MKYLQVYYLVFFVSVQSLAAQSLKRVDPFPGFRQAVFLVPQYVVWSGIRVDYERKLGSGQQWLVLAPQLYSDRNGYESFNSFTGFGLNVYYKKFLSHSVKVNGNGLHRTNVYFATGPVFQHFSMQSTEEMPEEYMDNGIIYIRYNPKDVTTRIFRTGLNADFGIQYIFDRFSIDLYGGVGVRFALDENGKVIDFFNDYWTDFGYTGFLLDGGIRLGFMMK